MSEETPDYGARRGAYVVMRSTRVGNQALFLGRDEAVAEAERMVSEHGGEALVMRLVGTARAEPHWTPEPDPAADQPQAPAAAEGAGWRTYP